MIIVVLVWEVVESDPVARVLQDVSRQGVDVEGNEGLQALQVFPHSVRQPREID